MEGRQYGVSISLTPEGRFTQFVIVPQEPAPYEQKIPFLKDDDDELLASAPSSAAPIQMCGVTVVTQSVVREWAIRSYNLEAGELVSELQRHWQCKRIPLSKDRLTGALADYIRHSTQLLAQSPPPSSQDVMRSMAAMLREEIIPKLDQAAREAKRQQLQKRRETQAQKLLKLKRLS